MFWFIAEKHIFLGAKQPGNKSDMRKRSRTRSEFIVVTATVQIGVQKRKFPKISELFESCDAGSRWKYDGIVCLSMSQG